MPRVLISYNHEDREATTCLAQALERAGAEVWWDDALRSGEDFSDVIAKRIEASDSVVVLWSKHSVVSKWVKAEADLARDSGKLMPARLDDSRVPLPFNALHIADLSGWRSGGDDPQFVRFVEQVSTQQWVPAPRPSRRRRVRVWLGEHRLIATLVPVLLVVAVAVLVVVQLWPQDGEQVVGTKHTVDTHTTGTAVIDTNTASSDTPDTNSPDTNSPDTNSPDANTLDTNTPDPDTADSDAPDTDTPETDTTDTNADDTGGGPPPPDRKARVTLHPLGWEFRLSCRGKILESDAQTTFEPGTYKPLCVRSKGQEQWRQIQTSLTLKRGVDYSLTYTPPEGVALSVQ